MNTYLPNVLIQERTSTPKGFTVILEDDILAFQKNKKYVYYKILNEFAYMNNGLYVEDGCINITPAGIILISLVKIQIKKEKQHRPLVLIYESISIRFLGKKFQIKSKNNKLYLFPT